MVLCGLLAMGMAPARSDAAENRVTLARSVGTIRPRVAATKRPLAASDLAAKLDFSVVLRLRDFEGLKARVARGETISRAELEERYLPLKADYEAVKAWAKTQGLEVTQEDASRLSVFMRGSVSQVRSSLAVNMVKVTSEGKDYPAADSLPSLPASIAGNVLGVNGLHPYRHLNKHSRRQAQAAVGVTYTIPDILTTYDGLDLGVTGAGQTIAILIDATPFASDLTTFWTNNGIAQNLDNITTINVNNAYINGIEGEETLDVEWSSGVAPGAKIRIYATGALDDASLDKGLARIVADVASDPTIHQLSISLGLGETYETDASQFTTDGQYFAVLASQGVSTFCSSGDGGSTPDATGAGNEDNGPLQVEYYASDPSVTGVGGTTLNVNASYARTSETAWTGSGGGVSIEYARPSWQAGNGVPGGTRRFVPDVCMPADPNTGAYVWLEGTEQTIGGTSWSAPTWAGFCALFNQARANAGKTGGIGLLNPSLYPLIGTSNFTDITSGSNAEGTNAGGNYGATAGYDRVTGIGAPDVKVLMNTLAAGTTTVTPPTITSFTPTNGPVGTVVTITGTNLGNAETAGFYSPVDDTGAAIITSNTATQLVTTVPPSAQTGPLTVTIPGGVAVSSASFTVTTTGSTPTITSFTPTSGKAGVHSSTSGVVTNGTTVTITGTNLTGATNVTFNGVSGSEYYNTPFTVASATSITAYVPVGATTGYLTVTTANGNAVSTGVFTVTAATGTATISSFTPTSGPVGTSVVINGSTFTAAKGVTFGTVSAKTFTINSSTKITATVPIGAVTGPIGVSNTKGGASSASSFTVTASGTAAPTVTGFNPASGPVGTSVILTGTNLTGATAVSFHGTAAGSFTVNSATQIAVPVPTGATTGTISVTTPGGTATSTGAFTVTVPAPTITNFTPTSGPVSTSVTVTGTNFTGATAITFNGTAASNFTVSSATQILVSVPAGATTGAINVTTPGGTAASVASFTVTPSIGPVVISQLYGGGGGSNAAASYTSDYIELFNPGTTTVDLSTYSVQYAGATSSTYSKTNLTGVIAAQHYYLVQGSTGTNGVAAIPTPDAVGSLGLSATTGKVALVSNQTILPTTTTSTTAGIVDYVGYGTAATVYEGSGPTGNLSVTTAAIRNNGGFIDTNNNNGDFTIGTPNPHNSSSPKVSNAPDLTVTLSHTSNFTQADTGDTYTVTVGNVGNGATTGTVSVIDTLPGGLTATAIGGTGWTGNLGTRTCTRTDALAAGGSYPPITLTVNVSNTAVASVTNTATVSGGGETNTANDTATDPTTVTALTPVQNWRYGYFGTPANSGNAADTANPAGDGLPNLVKYGLGLNPLVPQANPLVADTASGHLRLTVPKNAAATDLIYTVQVTSDLTDPTSWTADGTTVEQTTSTLLVVHDNALIGSSPARFIRLQISR